MGNQWLKAVGMLAFPTRIQAWFALAVVGWFCFPSETQNFLIFQGSSFQDC